MKILITGSTGMVGKNILDHPHMAKFEVLKPTRKELDLLDSNGVRAYLLKHKPEMVIHSAGTVGGIKANMEAQKKFLLDNLEIGKNVVQGAFDVGIKKLLNLGSSCMYPRDFPGLLKEDMLLQGSLEPTNEGYALAKIVITKMCSYIEKEWPGFYYKTLIPCNLYGKWDRFDENTGHMIPSAIRKVHTAKVERNSAVAIWGDGTVRREFMYVEDLVNVILFAVNNLEKLPSFLNVGLGFDYSINEYYQTVAEVIGYNGEFVHDQAKPAGTLRKTVDITKLREVLGDYKPTSLKDGLKQTYAFYLKSLSAD